MARRLPKIGNHYCINKEVYEGVVVVNLDSETGILKIIGDSSALGEVFWVTAKFLGSRLNTRRVTKLNVRTTNNPINL